MVKLDTSKNRSDRALPASGTDILYWLSSDEKERKRLISHHTMTIRQRY